MKWMLIALSLLIVGCTRYEPAPPPSQYPNPYAGQLGAPQRLSHDEFVDNVRQTNGRPNAPLNQYEERAGMSGMNIFSQWLERVAAR